MEKVRVMTVFGTRPEAIKLAPILQLLEKDQRFESLIVVTAQHREMLDQVLELFEISPQVDLNLMTENQTLAQLTASVFTTLDPVLEKYQPQWVMVQGDTTTAMAAALAAYYRQIKVVHIEAGLRTGDKWHPFPEEINRKVISCLTDLYFAPTDIAWKNLVSEGITKDNVKVTGNTIIDALNQIIEKPMPEAVRQLLADKNIKPGVKELVLVTAHRRESFGQPIRDICMAVKNLAKKYCDSIEIVYPVHLNPNIQQPVNELLSGVKNVSLLPPLDYLSLVHLMNNARLILTDSGGIQEEATGLGKPCLVLRDVTERPEGVEAGVLQLVGTNPAHIFETAERLLKDPSAYAKAANAPNPYGDGNAAPRIVQILFEGY